MAQTTLLFLSDTFQFEADTTVTASADDDDGPYVVTDATVFYPGGGGQEPDKGNILTEDGAVIPVLKAILKDGRVHHYLGENELKENDKVTVQIDREHRLHNATLHTGGHLLSAVVFEKLSLPLLPVKGFHYQQGAYIEFDPQQTDLPVIDTEKLHQAVLEDINRELPVTAKIVSKDDVDFHQALKPEGFIPPEDIPLRLVRINSYRPIFCGGTHLHHTGEINFFSIKHVKHKKGNIRISYQAR